MSSPESASPHGCQFTNYEVFPPFFQTRFKRRSRLLPGRARRNCQKTRRPTTEVLWFTLKKKKMPALRRFHSQSYLNTKEIRSSSDRLSLSFSRLEHSISDPHKTINDGAWCRHRTKQDILGHSSVIHGNLTKCLKA